MRAPTQAIIANSAPISAKPMTNPASGEVIIGRITFGHRPLPAHQCAPGCDQMIACQLLCAPASAAPHRPPTSACEELEGKPHHQVIKSQIVAPSNAQISSEGVTSTRPASIRPVEIVLATAVPQSAPSRLVTAASNTACAGLRALVATTVAIELAVS